MIERLSLLSDDELLAIAARFHSRIGFYGDEPASYKEVKRRGLLAVACGHMDSHSLAQLEEIAKQHTTRKSFEAANPEAYHLAVKRGYMAKICAHMGRPVRKPMLKHELSPEDVHLIASVYKSQSVFRSKQRSAYDRAIALGILDSVCEHMSKPPATPKEVLEIAKKCLTRWEFKRNKDAYLAAKQMGILDQAFAHMTQKPQKPSISIEGALREAAKYQVMEAFKLGAPEMFRLLRRGGLLDEACKHMPNPPLPTAQEVGDEALKYRTRTEFKLRSPKFYKAALEHGVLDEVCSHMTDKRGRPRSSPVSAEEVFEEAAKYQTRTDFRLGANPHYRAATAMGLLDEACKHMIHANTSVSQQNRKATQLPQVDFVRSSLVAEARRFKTESGFAARHPSIYLSALRCGVIEEVFGAAAQASQAAKKRAQNELLRGAVAKTMPAKAPRLDAPLGMIRPDIENSIEWHQQALSFLEILVLRDQQDVVRAERLYECAKRDAEALLQDSGLADSGPLYRVVKAVHSQSERLAEFLLNQAQANLWEIQGRLKQSLADRDRKKAQIEYAKKIGADWLDPEFFKS